MSDSCCWKSLGYGMCCLWTTFTDLKPPLPLALALKKQLMPVFVGGDPKLFVVPTWRRSAQFTAYLSSMRSFETAYCRANFGPFGVRGGDHGNLLVGPEPAGLLLGDGVSILLGVGVKDSGHCPGDARSWFPDIPEEPMPEQPGEGRAPADPSTAWTPSIGSRGSRCAACTVPPWNCCSALRSSSFSDSRCLRSSSLCANLSASSALFLSCVTS
mmetsp:Transcript_106808/g.319317  ORF Transcript_106808/g.319317 Transcript_106808/m.319317 type:complete len:214 (-) Transcript_106808:245-886(-)